MSDEKNLPATTSDILPELLDNRGRPTKFDNKMRRQVIQLVQLGYTDAMLADFYQVTESTLYRWKAEVTGFSESIKAGREGTDIKVMSALLKRALGYTEEVNEITYEKLTEDKGAGVDEKGELNEIEKALYKMKVVKKKIVYPPDVTAQKFWLMNRQRDKWTDPAAGGNGPTINNFQVNIGFDPNPDDNDEPATDDATVVSIE